MFLQEKVGGVPLLPPVQPADVAPPPRVTIPLMPIQLSLRSVIGLEDIARVVVAQYNTSFENLCVRSRTNSVRARQIFMYLGCDFGFSKPRIGRFLGGRDHTTVNHAYFKIGWAIGERSRCVPGTFRRLKLPEAIDENLKRELNELRCRLLSMREEAKKALALQERA
jgi:hypothetical protein